MYVCICNAVTDKAIKKAVKSGCENYDRVCQKLNVGTCCGQCKGHAREVFSEAIAEKDKATSYQIPQPLVFVN